MINILFFIFLLITAVANGAGPNFNHKDRITYQEFDYVYHDLRNKASKTDLQSYLPLAGGTVTGTVQQSGQPSFLVYLSATATNATGDNTIYTIAYNTEIVDQGSNFASNTFTAPVNGQYLLTATADLDQLSTANHTEYAITITTSNRNYSRVYSDIPTSLTRSAVALTVIADMDANDTAIVKVTVSGASKVVDISGDSSFTYFSGTLLN